MNSCVVLCNVYWLCIINAFLRLPSRCILRFVVVDLQPYCEQIYTSGRLSGGVWTWQATGRPFTFTDWSPGSPSGGKEDTVTLLDPQGDGRRIQWNDSPSTLLWCSICEFH